jgi:glucose-1-phosphate cytidylyltransferase
MKVIILAGGFGTRLAEYTDVIPKPMVPVGGHPLLWHILSTYAHFGHKDFYVALGYKSSIVKEYFLNFYSLNADFTVDLSTGNVTYVNAPIHVNWRITLVDTGLNSLTGGRVLRMKQYVGEETSFLTYGDGVSDIDIEALLRFHRSHGKLVTVTAVHPVARFGELAITNDQVTSFREKPQTAQGWINGGYFVVEPGFFDLIDGDDTILEKEPLERAAAMGEMMAYRHDGFWACIDTKRDRDTLEELWNSGNAPWRRGV